MDYQKILLVGGGGHCRSVLDSLLSAGGYDDIGIIDPRTSGGSAPMNIPVLGGDSDLPRLFAAGWTHAAVTLGSVGNPARRRTLYRMLKDIGFSLPVIADPSAVIGRETTLGEGVFIGRRIRRFHPILSALPCGIVRTSVIRNSPVEEGDAA